MNTTPGSGNVFLDLGFPPEEAQRLLAEADAKIAAEFARRQSLVDEILKWMEEAAVTPADAALRLGLSREHLDRLMRREIGQFTVGRLVDLLARIDRHVVVQVKTD